MGFSFLGIGGPFSFHAEKRKSVFTLVTKSKQYGIQSWVPVQWKTTSNARKRTPRAVQKKKKEASSC